MQGGENWKIDDKKNGDKGGGENYCITATFLSKPEYRHNGQRNNKCAYVFSLHGQGRCRAKHRK